MFGSARTAPLSVGLRQTAAAIVAFALVAVLTLVVAIGQLTGSKAATAPAAAPAAAPGLAPAPIVHDRESRSGSAVRPIAE